MIYLLPLLLLAVAACDTGARRPAALSHDASAHDSTPPAPPVQASPAQAAQPAAAETKAQSALRGCPGGPLELETIPSRAVITLGEPAVILVSLRNCSREPVEVPANIEPEYSALQVMVSPPDAGEFRYAAPVTRETRRRLTIVLQPAATHGAVVHSYLYRGGWLLRSPGAYRFHARLNVGKTTVDAPPVEIDVRPAPERVDSGRLQELWKRLGPALYFQSDVTKAGGDPAALGDARLAYLNPFVTVADLLARSQPAYDPGSDRFQVPKCPQAASAGTIVAAIPDPYFAALAASRLRPCLIQIGRSKEAEALAAQVRSAHPRVANHPEIAKLLGSPAAVQTR